MFGRKYWLVDEKYRGMERPVEGRMLGNNRQDEAGEEHFR